MKHALLLSTTLSVLTAAPLYAQSFTDRVVETLSQQGYQTVEIDNGPTQTKFEAVGDGTKIEVIYDRATGEILSQETGRFDGTVVEGQPIEIDTRTRDFVGDNRDDNDDDDDDDDDHDDDRDDDDDGDRDDDDRDDDSDSGDSGESESDDSGESESDDAGDDNSDDD